MIHVLLVGTDVETVRNFHTYIKTSFNEIRNISILSDPSKNVLDTVNKTHPDLIIADIRFFGVGGHQEIRNIYETYPETRFILYGTYNESEYMHRCEEYGVIDYLYRPVRPADFHRCLKSVLEYFRKDQERKQKLSEMIEAYKDKKYLFEDIFLVNLIDGNLKDGDEIKFSFRYFDIDIEPDYTLLIVRIDHFKTIILTLDEMEKNFLTYSIMRAIEEKLSKYKFRTFTKSLNSVNVILSGNFEFSRIIELCEELKGYIFQVTGKRVTVGIGRTYSKEQDIVVSYREAEAALRYRFLMGYNSVIHIDFVEPSNYITYVYPREKELRLVYTAAIGEYDYCERLINELFDALKKCEPLPEKLFPKMIMDILISINRFLSEQNSTAQKPFHTFFPSKDVLELKGIDEAKEYLCKSLKNFCEFVLNDRKEQEEILVQDIKSHFAERYYECFSLSKLATGLNSTPEYINKIFYDREKKNILDYAMGIRMGEAKRLLRETAFDDEMIAVKVGYDDAKHFRGVFKQYEGLSTFEYRTKFSLHN